MNNLQQDLRLLPRSYKKVAWVILSLAVLLVVLVITNVLSIDKDIAKVALKIGVLISLLILALSKSKVEDELTSRIRLKAFSATFIFGVAVEIFHPFVNLLFGDGFVFEHGVTELLLQMFIFYFLFFHYLMRNR